MLSPKRVKWRKQMRGRMTGRSKGGDKLQFGEFGLQAKQCGHITARQIEAARVAMTRYIKRGGDVWIRVFPHKPVTKKPLEVRMGKGKGPVEAWVAVIKPGRIIYEMSGVSAEDAKNALSLAGHKLPLNTRIVSKESEKLEARLAARAKSTEAPKNLKKKGADAQAQA